MAAFDRILCPVDMSEISERALQYAVALAHWYRSELTVLKVTPLLLPPALWLEYPSATLLEPMDAAAEEERVRAFIASAVGPSLAKVIVREGSITQEILQSAFDCAANLIVMGTHGRSGLEHLLLGSVAENILRRTACPVLTVPRSATEPTDFSRATFRTVLCAVDFSRDSRRAVDLALSLTQTAGGRLVLVHALEQFASEESVLTAHFNVSEFRRSLERDTRRRLEELIALAARTPCDISIVLAHGKASREVLRVAQAHEADLIVVGIHGRNAADLALFGSTTQQLLHCSHTPVLAVPRDMKMAAIAA
jgi:nucleotide-binding universal stress UspA family protein